MEDVYNQISRYNKAKSRLEKEGVIRVSKGFFKVRPENQKLMLKFLEHKEQDFRDIYGNSKEARIRNARTIYKYMTSYLSNLAYWFNDKPFTALTEEDIRKVYRNLESGKLKSVRNHILSDITLRDIYNRAMKRGFFEWLGISQHARKVIKRKMTEKQEVKFFDLDTLRKIADLASTNSQRLGYWLLYDTGIEVSAMVQLRKSHFELKKDPDTKTEYYIVRVPKNISKKGRRVRNIYIHFNETNELLKAHLASLQEDQKLFEMQPFALMRALQRLNIKHGFKTKPEAKPVSIKDFRSSCATYFLQLGWTTDEIKGRLGHAPSSDEIDKYVNYLGLHQSKRRKEDLKIDFNNYREKHEEAVENMRKLQSQLETEQTVRASMEKQMQAKIENMETRFLKMITKMKKEEAKKQLTPELVKKFVEADAQGNNL